MHRHGTHFAASCVKCTQSRASSTAAKLKPKTWDVAPTALRPLPKTSWDKPPVAPAPRATRWDTPPQAPPAKRWDNPPAGPPPSSGGYVRSAPRTGQPPPVGASPAGAAPRADLRPETPYQRQNSWASRINTPLADTTRAPSTNGPPQASTQRLAGEPASQVYSRSLRPDANLFVENTIPTRKSFVERDTKDLDRDLDARLFDAGIQFNQEDTDEHRPRRKDPRAKHPDERRGSLLRNLHAKDSEDRERKGYKNSKQTDSQDPVVKRKKEHKSLRSKVILRDVYIPSIVTVGALAQLLDVRLVQLQRAMRRAGMEDENSYDHVLTADYAILLAEEFGQNPIVDDELAFNLHVRPPHPEPTTLPTRPPVVTIMGHVDHGKTTLLDTLRSTAVAKGEAGGITQHIGAFSVPVPGSSDGSITFLDTPGHAAFSAMRARGAGVTDIIVLVVAADDGIMPQTREVIDLIKAEKNKVSVVVAINKVDKPGADVSAVEKALLSEGIELETFGGEIPAVEVSGLTGHNLPTLVETLSAIAEMQDIRAEKDGPVNGYVLEAKMVKGLGAVATVLVLRGSLKPGDALISGLAHAKVRNMTDSNGKAVKVAAPGTAVTVSGWKTIPTAGDEVIQGAEADIKKALSNRERQAAIEMEIKDVDAINKARKEERERREAEDADEADAIAAKQKEEKEMGPKVAKLIIKADVSGSAEAVAGALHGIGNQVARSQVISSSVGDVTESDIMTAKAAGASIAAFSVKLSKAMEIMAHQNAVVVHSSTIIYRLVESVTESVIDMLPKVIEAKITGEAQVLQIFDITTKSGIKKVAGSRVTNGMMERNKPVKVVREGEVVFEGLMDTMRILKKDVAEIRKGTECGLSVLDYLDLQAGDMLQMYETIEHRGVI